MSESIDILKPKKVAIVASNPAVSKQTGWAIGFWWSELTHPYWNSPNMGTGWMFTVRMEANSNPITGVIRGMKANTRHTT